MSKNEITKTEQVSLAPPHFAHLTQIAEIVSKSGMVPKDYIGKPGNVLVAVQMGVEIGLKPMQSLQNISVINGRPSVWGDALLALVKSSKACEYIIEEFSEDGKIAYCEVKRFGEPKAQRRSFSMEDAKIAGLLTKDNWSKYPKRMIQLRARAWALRDVFPDILAGMQVAEEQEDYAYTQTQNNNINLDNIPGTLETLNLSSVQKDGKLIVQGNTSGKNQILLGLGFKYSSKEKIWSIDLPNEEDVIDVTFDSDITQTNTQIQADITPDNEEVDNKTEVAQAAKVINTDSIPKIENIDHLEMFLETLELSFKIEDAGAKKWLCITDGDIEGNKEILKVLGFKNFNTRGVAKNIANLYPTEMEQTDATKVSSEAVTTSVIKNSSSYQDELPFN